jgi:ankyrin repeat protein
VLFQIIFHWPSSFHHDDQACVAAIKDAGGDFQCSDFAGLQPIHYAAQSGKTVILDYLITSGANMEARDGKVCVYVCMCVCVFSSNTSLLH